MELDYNSPRMQNIIEHNEELKKEIARLKGETYEH